MNKGDQLGRPGQTPAESAEQRGLAKGNAQRPPTDGTQCPGKVSRGLLGVREAARRDKKLRFTALLHHIDPALLRASFETLKREATPGVDGVRWEAYREGLEKRLEDLHERIHTGRYRALPSKRARGRWERAVAWDSCPGGQGRPTGSGYGAESHLRGGLLGV